MMNRLRPGRVLSISDIRFLRDFAQHEAGDLTGQIGGPDLSAGGDRAMMASECEIPGKLYDESI
jgi:hypothetical protein